MDYKTSGVNIDAGNKAVDQIKKHVKSTYTPNVLTSLGSFAAGFQLNTNDYKNPILVSCTDGVGTKVKIAADLGIFDTVGIDLVAMSVNDLICMGAKPLFFLDYIACHELIPNKMEDLVKGMTDGCKQAGCALIGGEMAEMNDVYKKEDFDLAGFCVGIVEKDEVIDGASIKPGHFVYGLSSSGIHSNGYSLVRKALPLDKCEQMKIDPKDLLTPTRIYVKEVLDLIAQEQSITGISHITGGGIVENLERVLPETVSVKINKSSWQIPSIFSTIQESGSISEAEMYKVFNMGIGMILISSKPIEKEGVLLIGEVNEGKGEVALV